MTFQLQQLTFSPGCEEVGAAGQHTHTHTHTHLSSLVQKVTHNLSPYFTNTTVHRTKKENLRKPRIFTQTSSQHERTQLHVEYLAVKTDKSCPQPQLFDSSCRNLRDTAHSPPWSLWQPKTQGVSQRHISALPSPWTQIEQQREQTHTHTHTHRHYTNLLCLWTFSPHVDSWPVPLWLHWTTDTHTHTPSLHKGSVQQAAQPCSLPLSLSNSVSVAEAEKTNSELSPNSSGREGVSETLHQSQQQVPPTAFSHWTDTCCGLLVE